MHNFEEKFVIIFLTLIFLLQIAVSECIYKNGWISDNSSINFSRVIFLLVNLPASIHWTMYHRSHKKLKLYK